MDIRCVIFSVATLEESKTREKGIINSICGDFYVSWPKMVNNVTKKIEKLTNSVTFFQCNKLKPLNFATYLQRKSTKENPALVLVKFKMGDGSGGQTDMGLH